MYMETDFTLFAFIPGKETQATQCKHWLKNFKSHSSHLTPQNCHLY